jgi:hypothetical protein
MTNRSVVLQIVKGNVEQDVILRRGAALASWQRLW